MNVTNWLIERFRRLHEAHRERQERKHFVPTMWCWTYEDMKRWNHPVQNRNAIKDRAQDAANYYDPRFEDDLDCIKPAPPLLAQHGDWQDGEFTPTSPPFEVDPKTGEEIDSKTGPERIRDAIEKSRGGRPCNPPADGWG